MVSAVILTATKDPVLKRGNVIEKKKDAINNKLDCGNTSLYEDTLSSDICLLPSLFLRNTITRAS